MAIDTSNTKVAIITGANSGIGLETARELVAQGYRVFMACRSEERTLPAITDIEQTTGKTGMAEFLPLDLGDLESVRDCAEQFLSRELPLHLLICNAGIAGQKGMTPSGFELTFGTCHMGHFLLTTLLLDKLKASAPARIVVVASMAHRQVKTIDFDALTKPTKSVSGLREYGVAKLANVLFARGLAKKLEGTGVTAYSLHPGVVATDIWRSVPWPLDKLIKLFMTSSGEGAATTLYCATDPSLASESGYYYKDCKRDTPSRAGQDDQLADRLWNESEAWVSEASQKTA
jgi:NAD(P)-dependent dehydrogenase (short-subunit alcohol dehydrogenase family)